MTTTSLTNTCNLIIEYSSFQLDRFFSNTGLNSGTRLQPIRVDPFIHVRTEPSLLDNVDPYISEVSGFVSTISWNITEKSKLPPRPVNSAKICYIELCSLEKEPTSIPDRNYWENYFKLDSLDTVAPNGNLYLVPDDNNETNIELQDVRNPLLFGYGVVFTVEVGEGEDCKIYYCRMDPVANIRSRPTE